MTRIIRLDYKSKKVLLDKNNIEEFFVIQDTRRKIRPAQVGKLTKALESGKSFPPLSVNENAGKYQEKKLNLDGNHRVEALNRFLQKNPDVKVEVMLNIYELDTEEEEREKFRVLNNSVTPSTDDLLQQYRKDVSTIKKVLNEIDNISIYGVPKNKPVKLRAILVAYYDAIRNNWQPSAPTGMELVDLAKTSNANIVATDIKAFLNDYQMIFGGLTKSDQWIRTTSLNTFFRLWYQNKNRMSLQEMKERWQKLIGNKVVDKYSKLGGMSATNEFGDLLIQILKRQRKKGRGNYTDFVLEQD